MAKKRTKEMLAELLLASLKRDPFTTLDGVLLGLRAAARELKPECRQCMRALLAAVWAVRVARGTLWARRSRLFRAEKKAA